MLARRVQYFTESVIREMTRLAEQHGALNLGQGMPDFDPPPEVKRRRLRPRRSNSGSLPHASSRHAKTSAERSRASCTMSWVRR